MDPVVWIILGVIVLLLVVVAIVWFSQRRRVARLANDADAAWSQVESGIAERAAIVPQLLEIVRGPASHEGSVFSSVESALTATAEARTPASASAAENGMQGAIRGLFSVAEGYPKVQTDPEFLALRARLVETENEIQSSRRFYNGSARELGTAVRTFPSSVVAKSMGERERDFFEVADRAAISEPPRVQF